MSWQNITGRLFFGKMKLLKFINLSAGPHATIIGGVCKLFCGKVQNKFLCLADHIVRKSGGTNGDAYHWRVGTHGASPRYCYYIIITLAICNADHHSRKRVKHIAWFPGLFCHIFAPLLCENFPCKEPSALLFTL